MSLLTNDQPKQVTTRDIARHAGVSQSTVSRALAGDEAISEKTREHVLAIAIQLNYANPRSSTTKALKSKRTRVVGVVVAALHNSFYTYLLERLHDELAVAGYSIVLMIDPFENSEDLSKLQVLLDKMLDGVVFTTATVNSAAVQFLHDQGVPIVLVVRSVRTPDVDVVESDNFMAGKEAAEHLLGLGHTRIGFVMGPNDTSTSLQRFQGASDALSNHAIQVDPNLCIWGRYSHGAGYSGVLSLSRINKPPTAIICGNDVIAIGALDAAKKHGIKVPEDLSIIGFDDIAMAGWATIQLTTIRQSIDEMAALAARRMLERIRSPKDLPARRDVLPASLVQRATTAPPKHCA